MARTERRRGRASQRRVSATRLAAWLLVLCSSSWAPPAAGARGLFAEPNLGLNRIVSGTDVPYGKYPFMASLRLASDPEVVRCGGTLIDSKHVLTAAHCVEKVLGSPIFHVLYIGGVKMDGSDEAEFHRPCRVIVHQDWDPANIAQGNDIALLELEHESAKATVAVSGGAEISPEAPMSAVGWGLIDFNSVALPEVLQEVNSLALVSYDECKQSWPNLQDSMMCATGAGEGDTCAGDSGGPLLSRQYVQAGIVSFGPSENPCFNPTTPTVYTSLPMFWNWVQARGVGESRVYENPECGNTTNVDPVPQFQPPTSPQFQPPAAPQFQPPAASQFPPPTPPPSQPIASPPQVQDQTSSVVDVTPIEADTSAATVVPTVSNNEPHTQSPNGQVSSEGPELQAAGVPGTS